MNTTNELDAAYARRATARANAEQAADTLTRAQRLAAVAADKVTALEQKLEAHETGQAQRLAAAISAGRPTPTLPADIADEGLAAELATAKSRSAVTTRALDALRAASAQAQAELAAAEAAVVAAVDSILDAGDIEIARQLSHHLSEAVRIGKQLLFTTIANETHHRKAPPAGVAEALEKLDYPMLDRRTVAINMLRTGDQAAYAQRSARRAEMIAGDSTTIETVAA
jgi:hypothetical protein